MKIISFIDERPVIEKRLRHLDLWDIRNHDPPQKGSDYILEPVCTELTVAGSDIVKLPENRSD